MEDANAKYPKASTRLARGQEGVAQE